MHWHRTLGNSGISVLVQSYCSYFVILSELLGSYLIQSFLLVDNNSFRIYL